MFRTERVKVLCFGDSITKGYCRYGNEYYPYPIYLEQMFAQDYPSLQIDFVECGRDGERVVKQMEKRFKQVLDQNRYDHVILLGGLNDMADMMRNQSTTKDILCAFDNMYKTIGDNKCIKSFIHITVPNCVLDCKQHGDNPYQKQKDIVNDAICNMNSVKKRIVLDLRDHSSYQMNSLCMDEQLHDVYWDDELHFTKEGYMLLAKNIYKLLKEEVINTHALLHD
ncbi:hypothetical protein RMATCC62417_01875 [Rhizopus microsporus]|nr:hypothetical protein RMATCC62417_01875 [Rhizopus microsporus]